MHIGPLELLIIVLFIIYAIDPEKSKGLLRAYKKFMKTLSEEKEDVASIVNDVAQPINEMKQDVKNDMENLTSYEGKEEKWDSDY